MSYTNIVGLIVLFGFTVALSDTDDDLAFQYLRWKLNQETESEYLSDTASGQNIGAATSSPMSNTSDIRPNCRAFIMEFGLRSSKFIKCSVDNARPFRFCEGCVEHYQRSKTVYKDIVENDENFDNCRKELLNSDRVQVISSIQKDIDKIWETADCKQCFSSISEDANGTVHYTLAERTKEFLVVYRDFTHCIPRNRTYNDTICKVCNQFYVDMNNMFDKMLYDPLSPQHVCMDIVDMMNYTRLTWGDQLKCTDVHKQYTVVLTIAIGLLLLPVIFYVSLKVYGTKRTRNLIKQKRLSLFQHTSTYGTLDSTYGTIDSPNNDSEDRPSNSGSRDSANQSASSIESIESEDTLSNTNGTVNNRTTYTFS